MNPYYSDASVSLYHGDMREILPQLSLQADLCLADPPYEETSLQWDRWPFGWPATVADVTNSLWCFGSLRMFGRQWGEFTEYGWQLSHDTVGEFEIDTAVWEKEHGSGIANDRFRKVHELMAHWYLGRWSEVYRDPQRVPYSGPDSRHGYSRSGADGHTGALKPGHRWTDDGTRLMRSVMKARSMWRRGAIHKTEKPVELLDPLIRYACPPGGLVLDPFAGSCSTGVAARMSGRRAVLIEADEEMCEKAVTQRLTQDVLPVGGAS